MRLTVLSTVLSLALLTALPSGANAAGSTPDGKFYVGLNIGTSRADAHVSQQFFGPNVVTPNGDSTGFQARFGYQFSRFFAVEAGYVDFGQFEINNIPYYCTPGGPATCTYNVRSSMNGPFADFVATWPFAERWALNAHLGAYYASVSTTEGDPDIASSHRHYSDSNTAFHYGAGLSFRVTPKLDVELAWSEFDQISLGLGLGGGAAVYDEGSSTLTSLGVLFRF